MGSGAALRLAGNLGTSIGPAVGGLIAIRALPAVFLVDGATSLLAAVVLLWAYAPSAASAASQLGHAGPVLRDRTLVSFLLAATLVGTAIEWYDYFIYAQAAALKDRFRVLSYDQRGHGETEAPAGRYAFDTLLDDALALMDALEIEACAVAGWSMGGYVAQRLAESAPTRVSAIRSAGSMKKNCPATKNAGCTM